MDVSSVATFRHRVLPRADCKFVLYPEMRTNKGDSDTSRSFAFVEYESRRDADDAYHEMHNKRIGRDDLLKIEVGFCPQEHGISRTFG